MPLRKQGTLIKSVVTLIGAAGIASAAPAVASAACVQASTTKAFSKVGDTADYSVAPGGDFETGATGWALTGGAKVVLGNETVGVKSGSKSLLLPIGATALSPEFCVDETNPYFRFVTRPDGSASGYRAVVVYRNSVGDITNAQFTSSQDASWSVGKWTASAISPLATLIPLAGADDTASVQLLFVSTGNEAAAGVSTWGRFTGGTVGTISIDSVMVDPYRRG